MKKKIILINSCKGLYGGVESFLLNVFYSLDPEKYDVTFLTCGNTTYNMFRKEIEERGGIVDEIPIYANTYSKQKKLYHELVLYFSKRKPDIVHINSGGLSFHYVAGKAAKKAGVKEIILHSHNFIPEANRFKELLKTPIKHRIINYGTRYLACSKGAAEWIFPGSIVKKNKVEIIPNGINTELFQFSNDKRNEFRNEINLGDELIIGNIGRFQPQKNHGFIIQIMKEVVRRKPEAKLLLAGEGELKAKIEMLVKQNNLDKNVVFLGERKDMPYFLSAIDAFILPSLHEGLPIAAIEAQASGVDVFLADTITVETNVTGKAIFLPIDKENSDVLWAEAIIKAYEHRDINKRELGRKDVENAGYDVKVCTSRMKQIYEGK